MTAGVIARGSRSCLAPASGRKIYAGLHGVVRSGGPWIPDLPPGQGRGRSSGTQSTSCPGRVLRDVSALASSLHVVCRLDRSFRLKTGRRVFGLGVVIAPIAQLVGIALEM